MLPLPLALAFADPTPADAPPAVTAVKVPDTPKPIELAVAPGAELRLAGGPTAKFTRFELADPTAGVLIQPDGKGASFVGSREGTVLILAYTAAADVP